MSDLKRLWKETEGFVHSHEKEIAKKYIHFLRGVAKHYISKGKRVFFRENRFVHYGEGGFGWMIVECDDDEFEVFGGYVIEIRFEQKVNEKDIRGCIEVRNDNLNDIKYEF
jgi:hypothetical protein